MSHEEENVNQDTQDSAEDAKLDEVDEQAEQTSDAEEKNNEAVSELDALQEEKDELYDQVLRLQAEIQNLQRRHAKNREDLQRFRSQDLAKDVIPSIDNLERALEIEVSDESGENLKKGLVMVKDSLLQALANNNIELVNPLGETFDPNYHEAYAQLPAQEGQESNQIVEVFEKGYKLHDRVLRPAKVAVVE